MDDQISQSAPVTPSPPQSVSTNLEPSGPTTTPTSQPKPYALLIGFMVIMILVLTGFIAYDKFVAPNLTSIPTPTPTSSQPSPTPDPTANWKTYTSQTLGFTIRYPQTWFVEHEDATRVRIQNYDPTTAPGRGYDAVGDKGKFAFQIGQQVIDGPRTIDQLKETLRQTEKECFSVGDPAGTTIVSNEKISNINGNTTYTRTTRCSESPDMTASTYMHFLDGNGKVLSASAFLDVSSEASTFDLILSTFQFISATPPINPTDETEDWTSYTDKDIAFQIRYPTNWNLRKTYGKSVNNTGNWRVSGVDISTDLSIGSTVVVNVIDPAGNSFADWIRLYSGETNPPTTTNAYFKNMPAIRIERPNQGKPPTIHTYFEDGGYIVFMAINTSLTDQAIGEQILSSFTFKN